ncbi:DMT family transporter [Actinomadura scrupuli]|uniref:DMT family transporter n=1 Tax=Actinomadura scrupuli TaxID=559629 RepID=UPI003D973D39
MVLERAGTEATGSSKAGLLPVAAVLVTVVLWASAFVAIRHVGHELSAGPLSLCRLVVAAAVLGGVMLARRHPRERQPHEGPPREGPRRGRFLPPRGAWPRLLVCGVSWFGVYNVALNEAERRVDAGTAAMLINIGPLLIAILAGVLLGEGFPRRLITGSAVAFAGVVVISLSSSRGGAADRWGVLLCVLAAVAYAIGVVAQKPLLAALPALQVTWLACTIGAIGCLPFAPALVRELGSARPSTIGWAIYLGVMPTALAFTTWAYALARTSAGRLGATTYLVPPLAIAMGWALLGETPAALAFAGGALCLTGVYLSRRISP